MDTGAKCSGTEYDAHPESGEPWELPTLGVADPGSGGPWEWQTQTRMSCYSTCAPA